MLTLHDSYVEIEKSLGRVKSIKTRELREIFPHGWNRILNSKQNRISKGNFELD